MSQPRELTPGYYWVWYQDEWTRGIWDGQDWDLNGTITSRRIVVGPHWTVPEKPTLPPKWQEEE